MCTRIQCVKDLENGIVLFKFLVIFKIFQRRISLSALGLNEMNGREASH